MAYKVRLRKNFSRQISCVNSVPEMHDNERNSIQYLKDEIREAFDDIRQPKIGYEKYM